MVSKKIEQRITIGRVHSMLYDFVERWGLLKKDPSLKAMSDTVSALERLSSKPPKELEIFPALWESGRMKLATAYYEEVVPNLKRLMKEYDKLMLALTEVKNSLNTVRDELDESEDDYYIHILNQLYSILEMYEADYFVKSQIGGIVLDEESEDIPSLEMLNLFLLIWFLEPYIDGHSMNETFDTFEEHCYDIDHILAMRRTK